MKADVDQHVLPAQRFQPPSGEYIVTASDSAKKHSVVMSYFSDYKFGGDQT